MPNLFLPVYFNIEKELLQLSEHIFFDDKQLSVYSIKIADLLIRTVIEIEAISKKLYFDNNGQKKYKSDGTEDFLYFDTDCIAYLENLWLLSKKEVIISAPNFYFTKKENIILTPLYKANKRGSSSSNWAKAYQAVKHDRSNNMKHATVKNLISALAALYLLNIYNRSDENIKDETKNNDFGFDSRVFSVQMQNITTIDHENVQKLKGDPTIVCIEKYTDNAYKNILLLNKEDGIKQHEFFAKSPIVIEFFNKNPNYDTRGKSFTQICTDIGGTNFLGKMIQVSHKAVDAMIKGEHEIVLNRNQQVYKDSLYT